MNTYEELKARGLIAQVTDEALISDLINQQKFPSFLHIWDVILQLEGEEEDAIFGSKQRERKLQISQGKGLSNQSYTSNWSSQLPLAFYPIEILIDALFQEIKNPRFLRAKWGREGFSRI